jgi:hypothetical protein
MMIRASDEDANHATEQDFNAIAARFNVMPILAVVLHDDTSRWIRGEEPARDELSGQEGPDHDEAPSEPRHSHEVAGCIMPWGGPSLFGLASVPYCSVMRRKQEYGRLPVTEEHLLDLLVGLKRISECGIVHGDISPHHIILTKTDSLLPKAPRLLFVNIGSEELNYSGDSKAMGYAIFYILVNSNKIEMGRQTKRVVVAAALLVAGDAGAEDNTDNIALAIGVLSPTCTKPAGSPGLPNLERFP